MNPGSSSRSNLIKVLLLVAVSALLLSCETVSYYTQAARGQLAIVFGREDIQRLLATDELAPELRERFIDVLRIRDFAARELALPVGDNYSTYVDLQREHVVWNVFAAPEFSTDPVNWCYLIAGCVSYRGYFSERGAGRYARQLAADGFDVYTGGVDAYSTLGWFDDSLLSTVMSRTDYQLAGLIFHELAHQIVYVPGDTVFNESFATALEREGVRRWLSHRGQSETIAVAQIDSQRQQDFIELVTGYRDRFDALYQRQIGEEEKRAGKTLLQQRLREDYRELKGRWGGYAGYDAWFERSLNNAQLSTVSSYNELVPFFNDLLADSGGDMAAFYDAVRQIARLDEPAREARLAAWPDLPP